MEGIRGGWALLLSSCGVIFVKVDGERLVCISKVKQLIGLVRPFGLYFLSCTRLHVLLHLVFDFFLTAVIGVPKLLVNLALVLILHTLTFVHRGYAIDAWNLACLFVGVDDLLCGGILYFQDLACLVNWKALFLGHLDQLVAHLVGYLVVLFFDGDFVLLLNLSGSLLDAGLSLLTGILLSHCV